MRKLLFSLLFFYLSFGYGQGLKKQSKLIEKELYFYLLDVESGLSNDGINSIVQDSLGFIWIGTQEGVDRYDGTHFDVYKKDDFQKNKNLSHNIIHEISVIEGGKLLIATPIGFNIYDSKKETFKILNSSNGLIDNNISCFKYGINKELILAVYGKGVQIINKNNTSTFYKSDPNTISSLSSNEIISLAQQGDSLLWVGTKNSGLNKINLKTKKVTRVSLGNNKNDYSIEISALSTRKNGDLWVGSNKGLYMITISGDILQLKKSLVEGNGLSDNKILCFEEDSFGKLWIGTRNGGLNIITISDFVNKRPNLLVKWYLPKDDGSSVFNRTVSALKMDWNGNMWIGTSTGLNYVNPEGEPIKLLRKNSSKTESLGHDRIGALSESTNGNVWVGTDGAGLDLYNPITGKIKNFRHQNNNLSSLSNDYIISLLEDKKKRIWVGTYQGGINKMDSNTGNCKHYLEGETKNGSDVRVIFEDSKSQIWVGTNRGGLYKYNEERDQFIYINSIGKIDIRDLTEDNKGYLWMATYGNGILRYEPRFDKSIFYNTSNTKGAKNDIISLLVLPNQEILAGTQSDGLIRLNSKKRTALNFTEKDGLSNNTVGSIIMENPKSIWLGTDQGISNYNALTNDFYILNSYTNIQQGKFNIGSGIITKSGMIYLGGDKGLNIFNPDNLKRKKEKNTIVFERLEVLNKKAEVSESDENSILDQSILYEDHIYLNHDQTFFSIDYTALKYPFVKNTIYSYRIDGYNSHWISTNSSGKVNIINLPHGNYTLNVKAKFGFGDEVIKKLLITIKPPFWKTPLAYFFYLLLLTGLVYGLIRYYSERIKLINSLFLEKKQRQLEYNLNEERIRFFTSFSHELKTPLTLILAPLEDLILEIKSIEHKNSLNLIFKNAKLLLQSINKLLEFRKSNLGLSKLRVEKYNLTECLEQWVHNYYPLAKKRDIALSYDFPQESLFAWFDLEKMHIIFNNLLSNAFKYMDNKGEIHVSLNYDEDSFEIKVRDTGYGIAADELEHVFVRYYQSNSVKSKNSIGIGLALSKNFTELHLGTIHIESELKKGSVFSVVIPRDKSLFVNAIFEDLGLEKENMNQDLEEWDEIPELNISESKGANINTKENRELLLLIDDNPDILRYLDGLLEDQYDLIYANNGEEGVKKALRYVPDLIISDVMMPKMNGIELCNVLKKTIETTHIPIILLTAKANIESIQEGYAHGADDYIVKPFSSQILQTRIRNLLDIRKQLHSYFLKKEDTKENITSENSTLLEQEKEFLNQLEQIILEHLDQEKIDVWGVAKSIGMSRTSLFRKIKAITGLNINQFITKIKIDKAAELLKKGDYTVAQASYEVGFNNVKYFRKLFKEQFGQLPSELTRNNNG
ncbi:two-component regulator propeller domain-containing protein [Flavobacterium cellulosilyticum]|nr:two-component regulator propeller domain-containing protein [Flavobacterium cellulosilyticum]